MKERSTATTRKALYLFVTLGPIGHLPFAPGTFGTALTCVLLYAAPSFFAHPLFLVAILFLALVALNTLSFEDKDPQYVVIDEFAGMAMAMVGQPITVPSLIVGFCLFRFFDILKPYPIRRVEVLPKGYGILADDIVAGIFVNVLFIVGRRFA